MQSVVGVAMVPEAILEKLEPMQTFLSNYGLPLSVPSHPFHIEQSVPVAISKLRSTFFTGYKGL